MPVLVLHFQVTFVPALENLLELIKCDCFSLGLPRWWSYNLNSCFWLFQGISYFLSFSQKYLMLNVFMKIWASSDAVTDCQSLLYTCSVQSDNRKTRLRQQLRPSKKKWENRLKLTPRSNIRNQQLWILLKFWETKASSILYNKSLCLLRVSRSYLIIINSSANKVSSRGHSDSTSKTAWILGLSSIWFSPWSIEHSCDIRLTFLTWWKSLTSLDRQLFSDSTSNSLSIVYYKIAW